ncbi:hypothetical protein RIB2604_00602070 [Aspergillus luchuensis]|uniref:Uncharacterized protein n=1 Tax=Aspergillus kawachii TaxID=1069201 RepID=A0A146F052_ASPKA|nr:hypothetical protein RIB2604_00602070 [Aspergillus luchuensis]
MPNSVNMPKMIRACEDASLWPELASNPEDLVLVRGSSGISHLKWLGQWRQRLVRRRQFAKYFNE